MHYSLLRRDANRQDHRASHRRQCRYCDLNIAVCIVGWSALINITGIGYEIIKSLLSSSSTTYHILLGCRDVRKGEAAAASLGAPTNLNPIQLDVTDDNSIDHCTKTIEQHFGKLDILINNAGTAGKDLRLQHDESGVSPPSIREVYTHVYNVNVIGVGVLTEKLVLLLEKSKLPKIIFITSTLGSISKTLDGQCPPIPWYNSSKAALNMLCAYYACQHPRWKVNACCPGYRATGLNTAEMNDQTDPAKGAVNAVRLALEGPEGATGTYSNSEGMIPW